jgi:FlaA1/EpsC-like NDP-sugar epimerase
MNTTHYQNKVVLVTGAGGSIGSEICRRLSAAGVKQLRMCSLTEQKLYDIERELRQQNCDVTVPILGSITDAKLMAEAVKDVDIVIHAAAHKHVPLCEANAIEAVLNNVGGTITVVHEAAMAGVKQFVMVSSDKAVKPVSVMGMTKRVCELYVQFLASRSSTKFTTVRFGNVLDSAGSVLPLWREQIAKGGPITLTDARCERYFMSIAEAVDLTLGAATLARCDGLFVLDMGKPKNMMALAQEVLGSYGPERTACIDIKITGLRPGERLTEELSYGGELVKTALPKVFSVREEAGRLTRWADFEDLMMAARCRHEALTRKKLKEICG